MSENLVESDPDLREQLLSLTLDEVEGRQDLLEYGVKPFLRKSNQPKNRYSSMKEELLEREAEDEDTWSSRRKPDSTVPVPEIVLSGRSRNHFEGVVGKIFAFNLLYEVTDDDLHTLFSAFGPLKRAAINYDRNGRSIGSAFIVFFKRPDAQNAFRALDGHRLDGRKLCLRLLDSAGMRVEDRREIYKNKGDEKFVDNENVFEDREKITVRDLDQLDLDDYITRRKRAKTWNYY